MISLLKDKIFQVRNEKQYFAKSEFQLVYLKQNNKKYEYEIISRDISDKFRRTAIVKLLISEEADFKEMN